MEELFYTHTHTHRVSANQNCDVTTKHEKKIEFGGEVLAEELSPRLQNSKVH